jgi:hypothetical protein
VKEALLTAAAALIARYTYTDMYTYIYSDKLKEALLTAAAYISLPALPIKAIFKSAIEPSSRLIRSMSCR